MQHSTRTFDNIQLVAFDADDTLWDNQSHFEEAERKYCGILSTYGSAEEASESLFKVESKNMPLLGYGCKAFTISLVENAVKFSNGLISADEILKIVEIGKSLLTIHATPLPYVKETLETIRKREKYKMVVFTKGELLDQQNKLIRSGLQNFFDDTIVVSDKTQDEYAKLCHSFDTDIRHLVMVGNSFRSDIEPVLQLGGHAVHIPFHTTWKHEKTEEYDHKHLRTISNIKELIQIL